MSTDLGPHGFGTSFSKGAMDGATGIGGKSNSGNLAMRNLALGAFNSASLVGSSYSSYSPHCE